MKELENQKLNFEKLLDQQHRILRNLDLPQSDTVYQLQLKFIRQLNFRVNKIKKQISKVQ
jgi:hypothetical protein